jgi:alpha-ketoglutarate-dependent taurine dioxygenase
MEPIGDVGTGPKPANARRRAITSDERSLVTVRPLLEGREIPVLLEPAVAGIDLPAWARSNSAYVSELLLRHRAILFRGFGPVTVRAFEELVDGTSGGERLEYRDRTTPRTTRGDRVYTSTIHPADQRIHPHNEGTYWTRWPGKLYLACMLAPAAGGETPIGDVRRVLSRIPADIREAFIAKNWMLVRNFNQGFGLPWQDVFQTESKAEVEDYCRRHEIEHEWTGEDRLRTVQIRRPIRTHPVTGEPVWFNHAAFFHQTSLDDEMRTALIAEFGEAGLPYNTYYGDGTAIPAEVAARLRAAYESEKVMFRWERGDVLVIDNMTIYHAREPFRGDREVIVAMTNAIGETTSARHD